MAKIKGTAAVASIRGKAGDSIYQLWGARINVLRSMPKAIENPSSAKQAAIRLAMGLISAGWFDTLTQAQRDAWSTYALQKHHANPGSSGTAAIIRGNTGEGRGYHAFMQLTLASFMSFGPHALVADPPLDEVPPQNNRNYTVQYTGAPDDDVDITWDESSSHVALARTRIWLWNPTRTYHKQLLDSPVVTAEAANYTQARGDNGANVAFSTLATGTPLWFQMDVINPSGQVSTPSETFKIVWFFLPDWGPVWRGGAWAPTPRSYS